MPSCRCGNPHSVCCRPPKSGAAGTRPAKARKVCGNCGAPYDGFAPRDCCSYTTVRRCFGCGETGQTVYRRGKYVHVACDTYNPTREEREETTYCRQGTYHVPAPGSTLAVRVDAGEERAGLYKRTGGYVEVQGMRVDPRVLQERPSNGYGRAS